MLLDQAEQLGAAGKTGEAIVRYEQVTSLHGDDPLADHAKRELRKLRREVQQAEEASRLASATIDELWGDIDNAKDKVFERQLHCAAPSTNLRACGALELEYIALNRRLRGCFDTYTWCSVEGDPSRKVSIYLDSGQEKGFPRELTARVRVLSREMSDLAVTLVSVL